MNVVTFEFDTVTTSHYIGKTPIGGIKYIYDSIVYPIIDIWDIPKIYMR